MQKPLGILIPAGKGWLTLASLALGLAVVVVVVVEATTNAGGGCWSSINGAAFPFKGEVTEDLVSLVLLVLPMVTPLLNTWVTLSMTLPLIMLDILALAAGCLAAAHSGFLRRITPPSSAFLLSSKAVAPWPPSSSGCSLFPFNLSLSESCSLLAFADSLFFVPPDPDLNPSECIRREISFEARSTTLLVDVLMLMSNSDKHHGTDDSKMMLAIRCFGLLVTSTLPWTSSSFSVLCATLGLHTHTAAAAE